MNIVPIETLQPDPGTALDFALKYAALGWNVFPVWNIQGGACACGEEKCGNPGKHPLSACVPWGQKGATTDPKTIRQWWQRFPDANIGIHLAPSGLCAIDIDPRNGGLFTMEQIEATHGPLVSDVLQYTGGGGEHRVFLLPAGYSLPGKLGKGVDVKVNGYIVAAPSNHISGHTYEWEASSDPLDGAVPSPLPDWIRDLAHAAGTSHDMEGVALPIGEAELADLRDALPFISSDDRETWYQVGMALHNDVGGQLGFDLWEHWSQSSDKFNARDQLRVWRSFSRKGISGITKATVFHMAQQAGWVNVGRTDIAPQPAVPIETVTPLPVEEEVQTPEHLLHPPGMLGQVAQWVGSTARKPQPQFDVQAAIAFCSTVMGRRYCTDQRNWPSLYLMNVGKSASGKEHAKWAVEKMLEDCGLHHLIGPASYTSNSGVISALHSKPSHLTVIDEFGKMLEAASVKHSARAHSALTMLMEVWARCDGTLRPQGYSTFGMSDTDRERIEDRLVRNPALTLLAMTTPDTFFEAIGSAAARDGFLNRFLIVESDIGRQVGKPAKTVPIPQSVIDWAGETHAYEGLANPDLSPSLAAVPKIVPVSDKAASLFNDFEAECVAAMDAHDEAGLAEMFGRCNEIAMKLSLVVAVACGEKSISKASAAWSIDYVRHYTMKTVARMASSVADSEFEAIKKQVLLVIRRAGEKGVTERELNKVSRKFAAIDQRGQMNVLNSIAFAGDIQRVEFPSLSGRGAARKAWIAIDGDNLPT